MKRIFAALALSACASQPAVENEPVDTPTPESDDTALQFAARKGLTDQFSYRRMKWGTSSDEFVAKMGQPKTSRHAGDVTLHAFDTSTQSIDTALSAAFLNDELVTIDIAATASDDCAQAVPKWTKGLTIKYGPPSQTTSTFSAWKLADGSRIVVDLSGICSIIYARDSATRVRVTSALGDK